ncbi:MAG: 2-amino-4-hydroxy-6-hydroxymethyldihydropteridine diphosphokinase [Planctomycetota bacterium]|nr:2-amino-4-hydroxy-6-hydroxymethyldihydropteridine diphosphokinase [Planctomycetota bacterium]
MPRTLISLGANLGSVRESMRAAKRLLADSFGSSNLSLSQLYRTPPVGGPGGQGDFLNAVAAIETDRSIWAVWEIIKSIESTLGRQRQLRWEARRIDIDLLLYDQQRIWTPHLKVPHPRMCMRTFVILPAFEIAPDWIEPVTGWSIANLKDHLEHSLTNDSFIRVICQDELQLSRLQSSFASIPKQDEVRLAWGTSKPHQLAQASSPKLTIAAVASPDPTTVLWEDCSKPWVHALNMETSVSANSNELRCIQGPRYLMPADDTKWAVHEILSADQAMRCELEAVEGF